jgi:hypothetical protein
MDERRKSHDEGIVGGWGCAGDRIFVMSGGGAGRGGEGTETWNNKSVGCSALYHEMATLFCP